MTVVLDRARKPEGPRRDQAAHWLSIAAECRRRFASTRSGCAGRDWRVMHADALWQARLAMGRN